MNLRRRELDWLLLGIVAAIPLYLTQAISPVTVMMYHAGLAAAVLHLVIRKQFLSLPPPLLTFAALGYLLFFFVDGFVISRSLIRACSHMLFFIGVFQAVDDASRSKIGQRLLVIFFIFVASISTATHLSIAFFIILFTIMMLRQMMQVSYWMSVPAERVEQRAPAIWKSALLFSSMAALLAVPLFPLIPRARTPFVRGISAELPSASTGLSDSIDFSQNRSISDNPQTIARIWMSQETIPFFSPLRLRGVVYETYVNGEWRGRLMDRGRQVFPDRGIYTLARPDGFSRTARVQQKALRSGSQRLLLPVGTYRLAGVTNLAERPFHDSYSTNDFREGIVNFEVAMARHIRRPQVIVRPIDMKISPEVAALARSIAGAEATNVTTAAPRIERYLAQNYRYVANPAALGRAVSVEEFLLKVKTGHCEYFAAGMVELMTTLGFPARIAAGFYGGELNPLTGYFIVRLQDAHAWVEVFDGEKWLTFDPTPPSLRPGNTRSGLLKAYLNAISDSMNYYWDRYILTFGLADQLQLVTDVIQNLEQASSGVSASARAMVAVLRQPRTWVVLLSIALVPFMVMAIVRLRRSPYDELMARLEALGIPTGPALTDQELLRGLQETMPSVAETAEPIFSLHLRERFSPRPVTESDRDAARKAIARLRRLEM